MTSSKNADEKVVPFPRGERQGERSTPATDDLPRPTMISIDSGLDGLTGTFAIDDAGNWIGRDGEVVLYAGEDMEDAVARMRRKR